MYTTTLVIPERKRFCRAGLSEPRERSATVCPQVSPEQSRRERMFTDISLGQSNRVAKFILRSRKCGLGIFLHRLESTMEASRCRHVSRRTSRRMFRQVRIVQQAFRVAIDEPRFNFDAPTPQTLDVRFPPSPSRFAFSLQDRRYAPISMPKGCLKVPAGVELLPFRKAETNPQFSRYQDTTTTNHQRGSYETKD